MKTISSVINDENFIQLRGFQPTQCFLKLEALNPAGSVKMKAAVGMIDDLERKEKIKRDTILIESSSGSLGVAISMVCAERGYRFICVVDPNTSAHNIKMMKALGADVVVVSRRDQNGGFLGTRIAYIKETLSENGNFIWLNQYANPENPGAHQRTTAPAIAGAFSKIDFLFIGAGTTGTLMGCIEYFQRHRPATRIVAVDSVGSVTFGMPAGKRYIPGLGTSRRPEIFSPEGIYAFEMVEESQAVAMCRHLARTNGLLAGGSTGTVLSGLYNWRKKISDDDVVVAISPDLGERYLDTVYDDNWVIERFGHSPLAGMVEAAEPISV